MSDTLKDVKYGNLGPCSLSFNTSPIQGIQEMLNTNNHGEYWNANKDKVFKFSSHHWELKATF